MAAPSYTTDLTEYWLEGATTVTSIGSGQAALGNPETDYFIQGTDCLSKGAFVNATKGFIADALGTTFTVPTDGCVVAFMKYDAAGSLATQANGGLRIIIGSAVGAYDEFYVAGKDTIEFDSWFPYAIDPNTATPDVANSGGAERWVGILAYLDTTNGPTKGSPHGVDAIRYGRGRIDYTIGDSGDPATFDGAEGVGNVNGTRWGLLELQGGAYQTQGFHSIGTSGTAVDFRDADKVLFWRAMTNNIANDAVSANFNRVEIINSGSNCDMTNIIWSALGTRARGQFIHTAGTCDLNLCQFIDWDTFTFIAASVANNCTFAGCRAVTAPGSDLTGSTIATPDISANTSGLIWDVATDPDGLLDNMTFTKTSGTAHHAIEFGTTIPSAANYTLRGCAFGTDFSSEEGGTTGDETFHFLDTTGTITLNLVSCTGNAGYRTEGVAVTVITDPVTIALTVQTSASPPVAIGSARVFIETSDGTGPLPFEESVVIAQSGGTATVTHNGHGLSTDHYVVIRGAIPNEYNKVAQITKTTDDEYTYAVDSGAGSPATGSPIASAVIISGLTNGSGLASDTRTYSSNQPFKGWARKSSAQPFYQNGPITGTISSTDGFTASIALLSDE
jgi:hypothetical protein